jgi:HD-GYP domain-containing protein (c-di-GMP phosphodiesterase class II)
LAHSPSAQAARVSEVLGALALAADMSAALAPETSLRTCLIAIGLGRVHGLDNEQLSDVFVAALLRHIGCPSSAHEETVLMGDERELRESFALVDAGSPVEMFNAARHGFAKGKGALTRAKRVGKFMAGAPRAVPAIFAGRCEVSIRLAHRLGLSAGIVRALDETYERFDGKGLPRGLRGEALSVVSRVIACAEVASLFFRLPGGDALASEMIERRAGGQLDPQVVKSFRKSASELLAPARGEDVWQKFLDAEPAPRRRLDDELDREFSNVLADVGDLKSPFTLGHSRAVARITEAATAELGLDEDARKRALRAALLHDVGRISVSNAIWDKPGPLDAGEWEKVRLHPYFTERIVRAAAPWQSLAMLASSDHERGGKGGYPRGSAPAEMPDTAIANVLAAADIYQALTEPRPHRPAREASHAAEQLEREVAQGHVDRRAADAVLKVAGHARAAVATQRVAGLTEREIEVVRLLARGFVDKEIAAELRISPRTVHHHNQHIYDKIGVRTRSGVALFVIENGLL